MGQCWAVHRKMWGKEPSTEHSAKLCKSWQGPKTRRKSKPGCRQRLAAGIVNCHVSNVGERLHIISEGRQQSLAAATRRWTLPGRRCWREKKRLEETVEQSLIARDAKSALDIAYPVHGKIGLRTWAEIAAILVVASALSVLDRRQNNALEITSCLWTSPKDPENPQPCW
eukprot:2412968-Rhodomonas_salina.9